MSPVNYSDSDSELPKIFFCPTDICLLVFKVRIEVQIFIQLNLNTHPRYQVGMNATQRKIDIITVEMKSKR